MDLKVSEFFEPYTTLMAGGRLGAKRGGGTVIITTGGVGGGVVGLGGGGGEGSAWWDGHLRDGRVPEPFPMNRVRDMGTSHPIPTKHLNRIIIIIQYHPPSHQSDSG